MAPNANIPLVDLTSNSESEIARQLVDAAAEHGFVYIRNRGQDISVQDVSDVFDLVNPTPHFTSHRSSG